MMPSHPISLRASRFATIALLLFAGLQLLPAWVFSQPRPLRVAAASDLQPVMPEIAKAFMEETKTPVEVSYGSSGNFYAQVQNGAPFDIFFSADSELPEKLIQAGKAEPRSAVVYAIGTLVLWVPATSPGDPAAEKWDCLLKRSVTKVAIANPAHAPYGRAAISALQSARVYERVRAKLVFGENISQAAQFAESGSAQAGILSMSQMRLAAMRSGKFWVIPQDSYPAIEQTAVILKNSEQNAAAEAFLKFISEGPGRALLQQAGFQLPAARPATERHK
jgi:molybdate transport system substrate-binding protein